MPKVQEIFKSDISRGVALGISATLVAVAAVPLIITATRPLARVALKSSLLVFEKGREALAEAEEHFEDLVAEVKAEMAADRDGYPASAADVVSETHQAEA